MSTIKRPEYLKNASTTATDEAATPSLQYLGINQKGKFLKKGDTPVVLGDSIDIIILAVVPLKARVNKRAYWAEEYDGDTAEAPDCHSEDGIRPVAGDNAESDLCSECAYSVLGSSSNSKGAKCKSFKDAFVVLKDEPGTIYLLRVPVMSLKNLERHRWNLKTEGVPLASAITRLTCDEECTYPKIMFEHVGYVETEEEFKQFSQMADEVHSGLHLVDSSSANALPPGEPAPKPLPAPTPAKEKATAVASSVDDLFGEEEKEEKKEEDYYGAITRAIRNCESVDELKSLVAREKNAIKSLGKEEVGGIRALLSEVKALLENPDPVAEKIRKVTKATLPALMGELTNVDVDSPHGKQLWGKIEEICGPFDPAKHGLAKSKFPALTVNGEYKAKRSRGTAKAAKKPPVLADEPDDLLGGDDDAPDLSFMDELDEA